MSIAKYYMIEEAERQKRDCIRCGRNATQEQEGDCLGCGDTARICAECGDAAHFYCDYCEHMMNKDD